MFTKEQQAVLNKPRLCLQLGTCVCGQANPEGPEAEKFLAKLRSYLKTTFWSAPKRKAKASERVLLEKAEIVLCLKGRPCVSDEEYEQEVEFKCVRESVFFHVGYVNFSSWRMVWHELRLLEETGRPADENKMLLQALSMTEHIDSIPSLKDDGIQVDVAAVLECLDLNLEYTATFFVIDAGIEPVPRHMMKCGLVQVSRLLSLDPFRVWLGLKQERLNRAAGGGTKRQAPQSEPAPRSSAKQTKLQNFFDRKPRSVENASADADIPPSVDEQVDVEANEAAIDAALEQLMVDQPQPEAAGPAGDDRVLKSVLGLDELFGADPEMAEAEAALFFMQSEETDLQAQILDPVPEEAAAEGRDEAAAEAGASDDDADAIDEEAAEAAAAEGEGDAAAAPRRAGVAELVMPVGPHGFLRYNATGGYLRAQCPVHEDCFRRRALHEGRLGQGRPIGSLIAWLQSAEDFGTRQQHVAAPVASLRSAARAFFGGLPHADSFLAKERPQTAAEAASGQEEPLRIP